MTPEEREQSIAILQRAIGLANKHGQTLLDDAGNIGPVASTAAAIMLSSFCAACGMTMHEAVDLFMTVHKQTIHMTKDMKV